MSVRVSYVFCLVRGARRPVVRDIPGGMPGGSDLRAIEVGDQLWAIVETVREADYGEGALVRGLQNLDWVGERAVAHERVIERFLSAPAVLPMQLFTMFTGDDRALEHVVRDKRRITAILKRIEHQVEWGLRVSWNPDTPTAESGARPRKTASSTKRSAPTSGADYLVRKREQRDLAQARLKQARTQANRMYKAISREATAAHRRTATEQAAPASRLLLDAAFLVPARRANAFRAAVGRHARVLEGAGLTVSLTGPWPAYNFI